MTERPDLTATKMKPDVLARLADWHARLLDPDNLIKSSDFDALRVELLDTASIITGLRDTCDRRLATIRELQRELADARVEEGR